MDRMEELGSGMYNGSRGIQCILQVEEFPHQGAAGIEDIFNSCIA